MHKGDRVVSKHGYGTLADYDGDDDLWAVDLDTGEKALMYPQELTKMGPEVPVARVEDWAHIYEVGQALRFIDQLKDRGDEPGEMMYDLLSPLAKEIRELREKVAKLEKQ